MAEGFDIGVVPNVDEMGDRMAIEEVLHFHSRGVDRACADTLKLAYWDNAEVAYGGFNGLAHTFCEMLPVGIKRYSGTAHKVSNITIEFRESQALVETYVTAYHYLPAGAEGAPDHDTEMTYIGRYLDRFEKRGNQWKILHRQVVMDWNQNTAASQIVEGALAGLARAARAPDDPLYQLLNDG